MSQSLLSPSLLLILLLRLQMQLHQLYSLQATISVKASVCYLAE